MPTRECGGWRWSCQAGRLVSLTVRQTAGRPASGATQVNKALHHLFSTRHSPSVSPAGSVVGASGADAYAGAVVARPTSTTVATQTITTAVIQCYPMTPAPRTCPTPAITCSLLLLHTAVPTTGAWGQRLQFLEAYGFSS